MSKELKIYVSKVEKMHFCQLNFFLVVKTNFPEYSLDILLTNEMIGDDNVFISEIDKVMGNFFIKFLKEKKYIIDKKSPGSLTISYRFNHEYLADGSIHWSYTGNSWLNMSNFISLEFPLTEREIILFIKGTRIQLKF